MPTVYLSFLVATLWLVLSGHYTPLLLGFGAASVALVVYLCYQMDIVDDEVAPLRMTLPTLRYVPWLTWEVLKSNLDVAKRVLNPALPISPQVIRVPADQPTALGRSTYANSITLTPGTLTMDAEEDGLLVHALTREAAEELQRGEMNRRITRLEEAHS